MSPGCPPFFPCVPSFNDIAWCPPFLPCATLCHLMILHGLIILHGVTIPFFPCATSCQYCTEKLFLGYCLRMSQLGHRLFCPAHIFLISLRHHSGKRSAKNTNQIREWSADNTISPRHRGNFLHVLHLVSRGRSNSLGILSSR